MRLYSDTLETINGGLPQLGNLTQHLETFRLRLDKFVPDRNFSGIGIIDFESWRPIFRQNWGSAKLYADRSIEHERQLHPQLSPKALKLEAASKFEKAARRFMQRTIEVAQESRPGALWAYYAYPYCFNSNPSVQDPSCPAKVREENDG